MKKSICLLIITAVLLHFAACKKEPPKDADNSPAPTKTVTVNSFEAVTENPTFAPTQAPTDEPTPEPKPPEGTKELFAWLRSISSEYYSSYYEIPIPYSADFHWSSAHPREENGVHYFEIYYARNDNDKKAFPVYIAFAGAAEGDESSAEALDAFISAGHDGYYYPIETGDHPHITRLYGSNGQFADFEYFYAKIDGYFVTVITRGLSAQAILSFDFLTISKAEQCGWLPSR